MAALSKAERARRQWCGVDEDIKSKLPKGIMTALNKTIAILEDKDISHSNTIRCLETLVKMKNEMKKEEQEAHGPVTNEEATLEEDLAPILELKAMY